VHKKVDLAALDRVWQRVAEFEKAFDGRGRIVLRASGTEPLVRVMVESDDPNVTRHAAETLAAMVREAVEVH
jgi:phosphoglucosamine mutase